MASGGAWFSAELPTTGLTPELRCEQHDRTDVKHYCKTHKVPICEMCLNTLHRSCKDIIPLEKAIKKLGKGKHLKKFTSDIDEVKQKLTSLKKKRQSDKTKLRQETDEAIRDIKVFRDDMTKVLDHMERKGKDYVERRYKALGKAISDDITSIESMINAIEDLQKSMTKHINPTEAFAGINGGAKAINAAQSLIDEVRVNRDNNEMSKFKIDPKVEAFAMKLNWYGKDRTFLSFEPPVSLPHLYTAKIEGQYDIKAKGDKNVCHITSMCPLPDGTILMADSSNNKVKQLDVSCKVADYLDLPSQPSFMCIIDAEKAIVAVCLTKPEPGSMTIVFLIVDTTIKITGQIEIPQICAGIACKDGKLYISTGDAVVIYTLEGEYLEEFYKGSAPGAVKYIIGGDSDYIYIVDQNIGMMTMDTSGEVCHSVLDGDVRNVSSICLDHHGQVFLATKDRSVVQFAHGGQRLGHLVADSKELKGISCIGYDRINSRLIITRTGANFMKVMELK